MKALYTTLLALVLTASVKGQSNGTQLFDESFVHQIEVTFTQVSFWDSLTNYYNEASTNGGDVQYMMATVSVDGTVIDSVGIKQKGYFSNWGSQSSLKKPLKISLSTYVDQKYDGLKKINLSNGFEDPSMMRDVLAYRFMRDAGIHAPRTSYAKVYLNGTYWGLYVMVEEIDKRSLKNWFPDNEGNLFKSIGNTSLTWNGTNPLNYQSEFELQTNETANDWSGFINFVDKINNTSGTNFHSSMPDVLNVGNYLYVLAADVIMYNWDSYYDHGRNFFLYEDSASSRMEWIPWDYNLAFSNQPTDLIITYDAGFNKPLVQKMQADAEFRNAYFERVCILKDNYFSLAHLEPFINSTAALIRPALDLDPNKFFTIQNFDASIVSDITANGPWGPSNYKGLKQFINERQTEVTNQLQNYQHECTGLGTDELTALQVKLYPNPTQGLFSLEAGAVIDRVEVYSLSGQLLKTLAPQQAETTVSLEEFASGTYLVKVAASGFTKTLPLNKE